MPPRVPCFPMHRPHFRVPIDHFPPLQHLDIWWGGFEAPQGALRLMRGVQPGPDSGGVPATRRRRCRLLRLRSPSCRGSSEACTLSSRSTDLPTPPTSISCQIAAASSCSRRGERAPACAAGGRRRAAASPSSPAANPNQAQCTKICTALWCTMVMGHAHTAEAGSGAGRRGGTQGAAGWPPPPGPGWALRLWRSRSCCKCIAARQQQVGGSH